MTREEIGKNIGATVTLNGRGDLAMEPEYRMYIDDCIGNYPLIIKKLTKGGMAHLYDVDGSSNIMARKFMSVPPKNVDLIIPTDATVPIKKNAMLGGKLVNAYEDTCISYMPDKDKPLGIASLKLGQLYECKRYELFAGETNEGCLWCKNLDTATTVAHRPNIDEATIEAAAHESREPVTCPYTAKELLKQYTSCLKGFEEDGTVTLLEEMIDKALEDARIGAQYEAAAENRKLRKLLWITHHCNGSRYSDGGEMQCNAGDHRPIDFKRDTVAAINNKLHDIEYQTIYERKIPLDEQDNVLSVLWSMIGEVEMGIVAESAVERHMVSQAYDLLNRIGYTKDRPRFESPKKRSPKKYEVGFDGELLGVYTGTTPEAAIQACKEDMHAGNFTPDTPPKDRLKGMIAVEVKW